MCVRVCVIEGVWKRDRQLQCVLQYSEIHNLARRLCVAMSVAVCCIVLQSVAECETHRLARCHSVAVCVAVRCSVSCSVLQCVLQCVVVCCSALQCVVVCCRILQRVEACCSVLQCVAVRYTIWLVATALQ